MTAALIKRMNDIVQSYVTVQEFMGSVAVEKNGKLLLNKGYGFANLEWDAPNSSTTKFRLGSLTKQFTAVAILLLEEQGFLNINDFINKYISEAPAAWKHIKIFNLLNHTHGIPNYTQLPEFSSITTFTKTPLEQIQLFIDKPLDFEPGTQYSYNNSGYVLLGHLIEILSEQSYGEFITDNIFKPLGMLSSGYDSHTQITPHRAAGYTKEKNHILNADYLDMSLPYAAGSLYSTTENLLKWTHALFEGELITDVSMKKMTTPFKENYGFGVEIKKIDDIKVVIHTGLINGFNTALIFAPETKTTIIALSNLNTIGYVWDFGCLSQNIALKMLALTHNKKVVLPSEKTEQTVSLAILQQYVGVYDIKPGLMLVITLDNVALIAQFSNQEKIKLFTESDTIFYSKIPDMQITFLKNKEDTISHIRLWQSGHELIVKISND